MNKPAVRHLLSLNNENHWSNLLASLMETDPETCRILIGLPDDLTFQVCREVTSGNDRPDIVLTDPTGRTLAVVEVKVLSGLGTRQLDRYLQTVDSRDRDNASFALVYPAQLPIQVPARSRWQSLTLEHLLAAFAASAHPWVAQTSAAALDHLTSAMPDVGPDTKWCALVDSEDFVVALRARQSWVYGAVTSPTRGEKVLHSSSAGVSWVTTLRIPTEREKYSVILEAEETLTVREWPKYAGQDHRAPIGPSVRLFLLQEGVTTSAGFDWEWLLHLWNHYLEPSGKQWVTNSPNTKAPHDKAGRDRIRALGAPNYLGIGYGEAQARISGECMFGVRYFLGNRTLQEVANDLVETTSLAMMMAECRHW